MRCVVSILGCLLLSVSPLWAECWNDSECDYNEVCECPSSSPTGNCDSAGTCVLRGTEPKMKDGYLVTLNDGTQLEIVPNDNDELVLDIGGTSLLISYDKMTIKGPVTSSPFIDSQIISLSTIESEEDDGAKKKCIDCEGRTYCITNGCANTPCGWICS